MKVQVSVRLKPAILDPQGKTILQAAKQLGFEEVNSVRIGKLIDLEIPEGSNEETKQRIEELSRKLLANPLMEDYEIEYKIAG